jgi:hypothetical protein
MARTSHLLAPLLAAGLVSAVAAPATAAPPERFPLDFSDSGSSTDFCEAGLTVQPTFTYEQTGTGTVRERNGEFYFQGHTRIEQTFTYDGSTVTVLSPHLLEKDLSVTDNGDGTWTIIVLFTGPERTVDDSGGILAKNDGQLRQRWIYDSAVDDIVSRETILGSTGTNDDFCAAVLENWGL